MVYPCNKRGRVETLVPTQLFYMVLLLWHTGPEIQGMLMTGLTVIPLEHRRQPN